MKPDETLDCEGVLKRLGGDRELMQEIFVLFREALPPQMERLAAAVAAGDLATVVALTHDIKGAAANIGAREMQRQASLLDASSRQRLLPSVREHYELLRLELQRVFAALDAHHLP